MLLDVKTLADSASIEYRYLWVSIVHGIGIGDIIAHETIRQRTCVVSNSYLSNLFIKITSFD